MNGVTSNNYHWSILTDSLSEVFGRTKLHNDKYILLLLKKVIAILR